MSCIRTSRLLSLVVYKFNYKLIRMPPGLRSSEKSERSDEVVINFLKSSDFLHIISDIVEKKTSSLQSEITALRNELKVIKESNIDLIKLLSTQNTNKNIFSKTKDEEVKHINSNSKVTFADKLSSSKKSTKNISSKEPDKMQVLSSMDKNIQPNSEKLNISNNKKVDDGTQVLSSVNNNVQSESDKTVTLNISNNKINKRKTVVYGTADTNCTIKAVSRYKHFHVFRLDPELSTDVLADYIRTKNVPGARVEKLKSKYPDEYSSFRVSVPDSHANDILDPSFWPKNTCVNRFFFRDLLKKTRT